MRLLVARRSSTRSRSCRRVSTMPSRARDETPEIPAPGRAATTSDWGSSSWGELRQGVQRAFERQGQQWQLGRVIDRRCLQQRAGDAQLLDLGLLERWRGGEGVDGPSSGVVRSFAFRLASAIAPRNRKRLDLISRSPGPSRRWVSRTGFAKSAQQRCHVVAGGKALGDQVELGAGAFRRCCPGPSRNPGNSCTRASSDDLRLVLRSWASFARASSERSSGKVSTVAARSRHRPSLPAAARR